MRAGTPILMQCSRVMDRVVKIVSSQPALLSLVVRKVSACDRESGSSVMARSHSPAKSSRRDRLGRPA